MKKTMTPEQEQELDLQLLDLTSNLPEEMSNTFSLNSSEPLTTERDSQLALEIVSDLRPFDEIAAAYGYTGVELNERMLKPAFSNIVDNAREIWSSDMNVKERIRTKAALLVEGSLLDMYGLVSDPGVNGAVRNASFVNLAKVAEVDGSGRGSGGDGNGFKLIINLPSQDPITVQAIEGQVEDV